jgi:uncharacterized protein
MSRRNQLLILVFLLNTILTFGQTNTTKIEEQAYIEMTGTAEKVIVPDEIYIGIIIREKNVNKVKVTIEEQEEQLKSVLKSLGIELSDLYLTVEDADYTKTRWQKKEMLAKDGYTLKVSNAATVGQVFQELEKLEITDKFVSSVSHSKLDSLIKEVTIMAMKAAKDKTDYMLAAINEQTGKPLIIKENEISPTRKLTSDNALLPKIKIQRSIYVKFSIK